MTCHNSYKLHFDVFFYSKTFPSDMCLHIYTTFYFCVQTITMNLITNTTKYTQYLGLLWIISFLVGVWVLYFLLYKFLFFLPTIRPATVDLGCSTIRLGGTIIYIILSNVPCLFSKFIFMNKATFLFTCLLRVRPWLFLSWSKYAIEDNTPIMN